MNQEPNVPTGRQYLFEGNLPIYYETVGNGELHIVFLHGFGSSRRSWYDVLPFLSVADSTLVFVDLKGFGDSAMPLTGRYDIIAQAEIISSLIDSMSAQQVVIVGHSYGGSIALLVTFEHMKRGSDDLRGLVLIDAAAFPDRIPFFVRWLRNRFLGTLVMKVTPARLAARVTLWYLFYDHGVVTAERVDRYAQCFRLPGAAESYSAAARGIVPPDVSSYVSKLEEIDVPSLIIWGHEDPSLPVEQAYRLNTLIPGSELVVIPECGHVPAEEKPRATADAINAFVAKRRDSNR